MDVETLQNRTHASTPRLRKRRKRSIWRRTIWPLTGYLLAAALAIILVNAAVGAVARPIRLLGSEYRETHRLSEQLRKLKDDNAVLERRIKHLKSRQGTEQAARKLGYVKPGEITLVIPE